MKTRLRTALCATMVLTGCMDGVKVGLTDTGEGYWLWQACYTISYDLCQQKNSAGTLGTGKDAAEGLLACHELLTTRCVEDLSDPACEPVGPESLNDYYGYSWVVDESEEDPVCPDAMSQNILAPDEVDTSEERMYWYGRLAGMLAAIPPLLHPSIVDLCPCLCDHEVKLDGDYEVWQPPYGKVCANMTYTDEDLETPVPGF